jgi:hypothetical protein
MIAEFLMDPAITVTATIAFNPDSEVKRRF